MRVWEGENFFTMTIHAKKSLEDAIEASFAGFLATLSEIPDNRFEEMPGGKWSAGQQLDHLIRSVRPVNLALGLPKFVLRLLFGKTIRASRTYEELVDKYKEKLAQGGVASRPFVPPAIPLSRKSDLVNRFTSQKHKLLSHLDKWDEPALDYYVLPHPLLGKLTVREMVFFTIYHTEHHRQAVRGR